MMFYWCCGVSWMSAIQMSAAAGSKNNENVTVIKMAASSSFQPAAPVQKTAVVTTHQLVYAL